MEKFIEDVLHQIQNFTACRSHQKEILIDTETLRKIKLFW